MTDVRYIKGLNRFNYWDYPAINPLGLHKMQTIDGIDTEAHQYSSKIYQAEYEGGNAEAIFEYAKADVDAFDEPWVRAQIKAWRQENTLESHKRLHKLMQMYTDDRGHDYYLQIVGNIKRDQAIFKEIITLNQQRVSLRGTKRSDGCFTRVAEKYKVGQGTVEEIYQVYKQKADELMGKKTPPLLSPFFFPKQERKDLKEALKVLDWDNRFPRKPKTTLSSWNEVFQWLDEMAIRLSRAWG